MGRVIHKSRVPVVPVFVNGLGNDLVAQVRGGLTGTGTPIHMVFGQPVDFGGLLRSPGGPRTYRQVAETCIEAIRAWTGGERLSRSAGSRVTS